MSTADDGGRPHPSPTVDGLRSVDADFTAYRLDDATMAQLDEHAHALERQVTDAFYARIQLDALRRVEEARQALPPALPPEMLATIRVPAHLLSGERREGESARVNSDASP